MTPSTSDLAEVIGLLMRQPKQRFVSMFAQSNAIRGQPGGEDKNRDEPLGDATTR